jgi:integrase
VGTDTVRAFVRQRKASGVTDSTVNRDIAALMRAFVLGNQHTPRKVVTVPYLPMAGPESPPRAGFFTQEEFLTLRSKLPVEAGQLVTFLYYTGCRVGEARTLEWRLVRLSVTGGFVSLKQRTDRRGSFH